MLELAPSLACINEMPILTAFPEAPSLAQLQKRLFPSLPRQTLPLKCLLAATIVLGNPTIATRNRWLAAFRTKVTDASKIRDDTCLRRILAPLDVFSAVLGQPRVIVGGACYSRSAREDTDARFARGNLGLLAPLDVFSAVLRRPRVIVACGACYSRFARQDSDARFARGD
jgi:hypothetical protein